MDWQNLNRKAIAFCAVALLFIGSLYYFVSVAIANRDTIQARQDAQFELEDLR
jgi:hypothetical protein